MSSLDSARIGLGLVLLCAAPLLAQEKKTEEVPLERVHVPQRAFSRILARHPGGVLLTEAELDKLVARANTQPPVSAPQTPSPVLAAIQKLSVSGRVEGDTAVITCDADVAVLRPGPMGLPLPLSKLGLEGVWVEGQPAQVVLSDQGPVVVLQGGETPTTQRVTWRFGQRVLPLDEAGAGRVQFPLPAAASSSLALDVPGELELVARGGQSTLWSKHVGGRTQLLGAIRGSRGHSLFELAWRPLRAAARLTPYVTATARSLLTLKRGVVELVAHCGLDVYRADRQRFALELPPGFVVRSLTCPQSKLTYLQRGDRLEVSLPALRRGRLDLALQAELPVPPYAKEGAELSLGLRPLRFLDVQRTNGVVGVAAGPETLLRFKAVTGLERADLSAYGGRPLGLLRVYRRTGDAPSLELSARAQTPRVSLTVQAALELERRQVNALALYRFAVQAGTVFSVRARLPEGYALERALVRDAAGREPAHRISERAIGGDDPASRSIELTIELPQGLPTGQELLLTVAATREAPQGLAGSQLPIPRFTGSPMSELRGHLGFAPDPAFRLAGADLQGLLPIPAAELPRVGLDVPGLVLGYRVESEKYTGVVQVLEKETRLSVEHLAHHRVHERVLTSELRLDLDVQGAPIDSLELLVPAGIGPLVSVSGDEVLRDREVLGQAADGRDRVKVAFSRRFSGERSLRVRFQTKLPSSEADTLQAELPRVSVAGSARERGTLAVFSSGAAEVSAEASGLRAIEVTEVAALSPQEPVQGRPLFAYSHVRDDHDLTLAVKRHGSAPVLTAVAELLDLTTSAGPDGSARHVARFHLKNLSNQFFALKLPEGAVLWSVVVDGQGVKPAAQKGVQLVPIPTAGTKGPNQITEVVATYTEAGSAWGVWGSSGLTAPTLAFGDGGDAVPVLHTRWALSLPEDYRVLSVAGNLDGEQIPGVRPLLARAWISIKRGPLPYLGAFSLLALLVAASSRGRAAALNLVGGASDAASGAGGSVATAAVTHGRFAFKALLVILLIAAIAGTCISSLSMAKKRVRKSAQQEMAKGDRAGKAPQAAPHSPPTGATPTPAAPEKERRLREAEIVDALKSLQKDGHADRAHKAEPNKLRKAMEKKKGKKQDFRGLRRKPKPSARPQPGQAPARRNRGRPGGVLPPTPAKPSEPVPMDEEAPEPPDYDGGMTQIDPPSLQLDADPSESEAGPSGGEGRGSRVVLGDDDDSPDVSKGEDMRPLEDLPASKEEKERSFGRQAAGPGNAKTPERLLGQLDTSRFAQDVKARDPNAANLPQTASGWQVGLRSLVLDLSPVGSGRTFVRPGGEGQLEVSLVRESALVVFGGILALLAFLGAVFLPRTGKLSGAALVITALTTLTVGAALAPSASLTPLLNATTLGLLAAAPVLLLVALGRRWEQGPFAQLREALRARKEA